MALKFDPVNHVPIIPFLEELYILPNGENVKLFDWQKAFFAKAFTPDENGILPYKHVMYSSPKKCKHPDERILLANGTMPRVGDLINDTIQVQSWNENMEYSEAEGYVNDNGYTPMYRVHLRSGRKLTISTNEPVLSMHGEEPISNLNVGDSIALPKFFPPPTQPINLSQDALARYSSAIMSGDTPDCMPQTLFKCSNENLEWFFRSLGSFKNNLCGSREYVEDLCFLYGRLGIHPTIRCVGSNPDRYQLYHDNEDAPIFIEKPGVVWDEIVRLEDIGSQRSICVEVPDSGTFVSTNLSFNSGKSQVAAMLILWYALSGIGEPNNEVIVCVSPNTNVKLPDGSIEKISTIVNNKLEGPVLTLNEQSGQIESRRVVNWYKNSKGNRKYLRVETDNSQIELTDNHKVLTDNGWIPAGELRIGDRVATPYRDITKESESVYIGSMLGDGCITRNKKKGSKYKEKNDAQLRFSNGNAQIEYFLLKSQLMANLGKYNTYHKDPSVINGRFTRHLDDVENVFYTPLLPQWTKRHSKWYKGSQKIIPKDITLDPLSLAVWFMDDGTYVPKDHNGKIYTQSFTIPDVKRLVKVLNKQFSIKCSYYLHTNKYPIIYISTAGMVTLSEIISRYVPPSMRYKLSDRAKLQDFDSSLWKTADTSIYYATVTAIKKPKINRNTLYCIEVEGTHNFIGNCTVLANCANSKEQAGKRVFRAVKDAIRQQPLFAAECAKPPGENIINFKNGTTIEICASEYSTIAGANPGLVSIDELHAWVSKRDRELWAELTTPPTRKNAMKISTTYAGIIGESDILYDIYKELVVPENQIDIGNFYVESLGEATQLPVYEKGPTITLWDTIGRTPVHTKKYLDEERSQPGMNISNYLRMHHNEWVVGTAGMELDKWDQCVEIGRSLNYLAPSGPNRRIQLAVGIDCSLVKDRTAVVSVFKQGSKLWLGPRKTWQPSKEEPLNFKKTIIPFIRELNRSYGITAGYYDPWQLESVGQDLRDEGIMIWPWTQTEGNTIKMTEHFLDILREGNFVMYPDDELRKEAAMVTLKEHITKGRRFIKDKGSKKIDSLIALAMACLAGGSSLPDMDGMKDQIFRFRLHR